MPIQSVNGIDLYYELKGEGSPSLFISGFSSHHQRWAPFIEHFSSKRQTLSFDNRGSGQSGSPPPPYTISLIAKDVIALLDALGISKVDVIGSSMGSAIALTMALNYPERVRKGVLISPFAKLPQTSLLKSRAIGKLIESKVPLDLVVGIALPWLFSNEFLSQDPLVKDKVKDLLHNPYPQSMDGYFGQLSALESFDLRSKLSEIDQKILLIAGEEDLSTPLYCAEFLAAHLPLATLEVIPQVGHMVHVERRGEVIELIDRFL